MNDSHGQDPIGFDVVSELQAPLLGIAANARVARTKLGAADQKVLEYLDAIEFSSKNLVKTIDVLVHSRSAEGLDLNLNAEPLHLGLQIEEAIEKLAPLCRVQAQIFDFKLKNNALVAADRDCLELVLYHFLEQSLRSSSTEEIIGVEVSRSGTMARIRLNARGGFEKATSLRKALKNALSGKAMFGVNFSLAASIKLLNTMGGRFNITQRKDGVSFILDLPLSRQMGLI
jgi:K+-sensing histidine kinase KdpD